MADWNGRFDRTGSPVLPITVVIDGSRKSEVDANLDTGFTGFLCLPLSLFTIFKSDVVGSQPVTFADGFRSALLQIKASMIIEGETITGIAVIEPEGKDALLGMQFLRVARCALILRPAKEMVVLQEEL